MTYCILVATHLFPHCDDQSFGYAPGVIPQSVDRLKINEVLGAKFFCEQKQIFFPRRCCGVLFLGSTGRLRLFRFSSPRREPNLETTMPLNCSLHQPRTGSKPTTEAIHLRLRPKKCARTPKRIIQCQSIILIG